LQYNKKCVKRTNGWFIDDSFIYDIIIIIITSYSAIPFLYTYILYFKTSKWIT